MALSLGNALGALTKKQTGSSNNTGEKTLIDFINKINAYGISTKARYEVNFSGISDLTFFVTDINIPDIRQNFGNIYFEGKSVEIPVNIEYSHDISMTLLNDAEGIIYTTIINWLFNQDSGESIVNSGYTMTIRLLGDGLNHKGMTITLNGVRMKGINGISLSSSDSGILTFGLSLSVVSFTATMGSVQKTSGFMGALKSLLS